MKTRTHQGYKSDKDRAIYAEIKTSPPLIVRVDGRKFKHVLRDNDFKKPYDEQFARSMAEATVAFFDKSGFNPVLAYIFSDEINILFASVPFKGRLEKLDSVIASFIASSLTLILDFEDAISFDARVIPVCGEKDTLDYLAQRQAEAWRNHINAYGFYGLIEDGLTKTAAGKWLRGMKAKDVHEMLFRMGVNLNETPKWQRRGFLVAKQSYDKSGYNPKTEESVTILRYKTVQYWDLPLFTSEEGRDFVCAIVKEWARRDLNP